MRTSLVSILVHSVIICFFAFSGVSGDAATLVRSEMANWSWHQSTVLAGFLRPGFDRSKDLAVYSAAPTRATYAKVWKTKGASKGLYLLLPGTGAEATSLSGALIAEQISDAGYDVVVLPSPFSETFQRTFSHDGVIGIPQRDIPAVEEMLESAIQEFELYHGRTREVNLIGYSLGGMYTSLIAASPMAQRFHRFIALNPPLEFGHAVQVIDKMIALIPNHRRFPILDLVGNLLDILARTKYGIEMGNMALVQSSIGNDEKINQQIIGTSFQFDLKEIVQRGRRLPLWPSDGPAERITFAQYINWLGTSVVPHEPGLRGKSVPQLTAELGFNQVRRRLKAADRFYVITAADDMLNRPEALRVAGQVLGDRLIIFDKGGHGGYFWTPTFRQVFRSVLLR